jgi:hypothetical protein
MTRFFGVVLFKICRNLVNKSYIEYACRTEPLLLAYEL